MGNINRTFALLLIGVIAISSFSLLSVTFVSAQTIPKPSVPEFTINIVDRSYTVPANYTYTTNPYNGEQTRTGHGEYRIDNQTIELTIKNQPITPYKEPNTQVDYLLCYNVSWKGQYEEAWQYFGLYYDGYTDISGCYSYGHKASESSNSIIVFGFGTDRASTDLINLGELPNNSKIDFRVQALFGYYTGAMVSWTPGFRPSYDWFFTGVSSEWSNPQTTVLPTQSPSPIPNSLNSILENQQLTDISLVVAVVVLAVAVASLLVYVRRIKKQLPKQ